MATVSIGTGRAIAPWNEQREAVFLDRYALKDRHGMAVERYPVDMWDRVSKGLARNESERLEFLQVLSGFRFVPAGRILSGVGQDTRNTWYNCFVLGVGDAFTPRDSRDGIMSTVTRMVDITSRGGGVGINWAPLRPSGTRIVGVDGNSSGAVSWMAGADHMVNSIRQGGSRTAALMYILPVWHPDVWEFCEAMFLRANHSVAVSRAFMDAVRNDEFWPFEFPDTRYPNYDHLWDGDLDEWKRHGMPVIQYGGVSARVLWNHMADCARRTGNPGCVFIDTANVRSNTKRADRLISTNPCGEQWLPEDGCCNLGAINLPAHWDEERYDLDYDMLFDTILGAVRLLDAVIDKSPVVTHAISSRQIMTRRIGIGTMGLADLLILKEIRYGSEVSTAYIDELYSWIQNTAYLASAHLANELGRAPAYDESFLDLPNVLKLNASTRQYIREYGIRNMTLTSQAPTGTTSIIAGASSGIEPIFASEYTRRDATGEHRVVHHLWDDEPKPWHVVAGEIPVREHIAVQAAIQEHSDNAVSKTINLPSTATTEDILEAYQQAYESGCKGITVYVDGSRAGVLQLDTDCPTGECEI